MPKNLAVFYKNSSLLKKRILAYEGSPIFENFTKSLGNAGFDKLFSFFFFFTPIRVFFQKCTNAHFCSFWALLAQIPLRGICKLKSREWNWSKQSSDQLGPGVLTIKVVKTRKGSWWFAHVNPSFLGVVWRLTPPNPASVYDHGNALNRLCCWVWAVTAKRVRTRKPPKGGFRRSGLFWAASPSARRLKNFKFFFRKIWNFRLTSDLQGVWVDDQFPRSFNVLEGRLVLVKIIYRNLKISMPGLRPVIWWSTNLLIIPWSALHQSIGSISIFSKFRKISKFFEIVFTGRFWRLKRLAVTPCYDNPKT